MRALRGIVCDLDVLFDNVKLGALLVDHVCDIAEQLVELADGLLNVADLRFALNDERFLEVHVVLVGQTQLLLLLLLLLAKVASPLIARRGDVLESGTGCLSRGLFLL